MLTVVLSDQRRHGENDTTSTMTALDGATLFDVLHLMLHWNEINLCWRTFDWLADSEENNETRFQPGLNSLGTHLN